MKENRLPEVLGLNLTRQALRVLKERGIFAHSPVSLEHQHLAMRNLVVLFIHDRCGGGIPAAGVCPALP